MSQQQSALPHLPNGMTIPQVQISAEPMMPGQKMITSGEEQHQSNDDNPPSPSSPSSPSSARSSDPGYRRATQGIPFSERSSNNQLVPHAGENPPPMFSAQPRRIPSIRRPMDNKLQKDVYRLESGIDPVGVMSNRLESWRLAIKNLVGVFKKICEVEESSSKGWVGAGRTIQVPFQASNGQFLQSGGIQDVWSAIRDYSNEHGILHRQFATYVRDTLIPSLRSVKGDIKNMLVSIQNDKQLKSTEIFECRMKLDKNIARLEKNIQGVDRAPQNASQCTDPFLINLAIIHNIRELCDHENRLHDSALALQKEVGVFEQKIIENCRFIMQNLHNFRLEHKMEDIENIGLILQTFDNIQPFTEWNDFIRRNQNSLVMENSAYKTEDSIPYPNQNNKYIRASKIGQLSTKQGGLNKTWMEGVFVVTPAGFLHGYKTPQYFQSNPTEPTFTIFIPDTNIIPSDVGDATFKIKYKPQNKNKKTHIRLSSFNGSLSSLQGRGSHSFLARNQEESIEWQNALRAISARFEVVPLIDNRQVIPPVHQQNRNLPAVPARILPAPSPEEQNKFTASPAPSYDDVYAPGYTQFHFNQAPPHPSYQQPPPQQQQQQPPQQQQQQQQQNYVPNVATVNHTGYSEGSVQTAIPTASGYPHHQANMDAATAAGMSSIQNPSISPYDILNMASSGMATSSVPSTGEYADPSLSEYEAQHLNGNRHVPTNYSSSSSSEDEEELVHQNQEVPVAHNLPNPGNPFDQQEPASSTQQQPHQEQAPAATNLPNPGNPFEKQDQVPSTQQQQQQQKVEEVAPAVEHNLPNPGNPFDQQDQSTSVQQPQQTQQQQEIPVTHNLPKLGNPFELDQQQQQKNNSDSSDENWQSVNEYSNNDETSDSDTNTIEYAQQQIQREYDPETTAAVNHETNTGLNKQTYRPGLNLDHQPVQANAMDNKKNAEHSV